MFGETNREGKFNTLAGKDGDYVTIKIGDDVDFHQCKYS
jgi:hypothetical protein